MLQARFKAQTKVCQQQAEEENSARSQKCKNAIKKNSLKAACAAYSRAVNGSNICASIPTLTYPPGTTYPPPEDPHDPNGRRNDRFPLRLRSSSLSSRSFLAANLHSAIVAGGPASNSGSTSRTFSRNRAGSDSKESTRFA